MTKEGENRGKEGFKINFNPDQLRKFLRSESNKDSALFTEVYRHSRNYQDALGLSFDDVVELQRRQGRLGIYPGASEYISAGLVRVEVNENQFAIFSKHTACHEYSRDHNWEYLLMAISSSARINRIAGGGTTWITSVGDDWHRKIIQAIRISDSDDDLSSELFRLPKK